MQAMWTICRPVGKNALNWTKGPLRSQRTTNIRISIFRFVEKKTLFDMEIDRQYNVKHFQPEWMKTKEYWDKSFETRFEKIKKNESRPPLKVWYSRNKFWCENFYKKNRILSDHHSTAFAQRSRLVKDFHQLLSIGFATNFEFSYHQNARVHRHDFYLVGNKLFATVVGSGTSNETTCTQTTHSVWSIRGEWLFSCFLLLESSFGL